MSAAKEAVSSKTRRVYQCNWTEVHFGYISGGSFLAMKGISSDDIINPSRRNVKQIVKQNLL